MGESSEAEASCGPYVHAQSPEGIAPLAAIKDDGLSDDEFFRKQIDVSDDEGVDSDKDCNWLQVNYIQM